MSAQPPFTRPRSNAISSGSTPPTRPRSNAITSRPMPPTRPRSNAIVRRNVEDSSPFTTAPKAWTIEDIAISSIERGDVEDLCWSVIECISEAVGNNETEAIKNMITICVKGAKAIATEGSVFIDLSKLLEESLLPNPYFITHGIPLTLSPKTNNYLVGRSFKKIGGAIWCWGGAVASVATYGVDVGTASLGAQSLALTGVHAIQMVRLRNRYDNEEFRGYIDICLTAKAVKATSRGIDTAGALIPGASLGVKIGMTAVNAIVKVGAKLTLGKAIDRASQLLHMHAYWEQSDVGDKPATELIKEIFKRRGILGGFGYLNQYNVEAIINEPAGWMALSDKLKLI